MLYIDQNETGATLLFPSDGHALPASDVQPAVVVRSTVGLFELPLEGEWDYPSESFWALVLDAPAGLTPGEWEWTLSLEGETVSVGILQVGEPSVEYEQYQHTAEFEQYDE